MAISEVGQNQAFIRLPSQDTIVNNKNQQVETTNGTSQSSDGTLSGTNAQQDTVSFNVPQANTDSLNSKAKSIRTSDTAMQHVNEYVAKMKAQLNVIVKRYPPFPIDSKERADSIKQYEELRMQINDKAMPLDDLGAQMIMTDPTAIPDTVGNSNVPINGKDTTTLINKQEVHTGPTGLNIPSLSDRASDGEVQAAISSLDKAAATVASKRAALASDAAAIVPAQKTNSDLPALPALGAEQKSVEVKNSLASEVGASVTDKRLQLLTFLG